MKKLLLSAAVVALSASAASAQTIYSQDFEDTAALGTVSVADIDGDGNNWGLYDLSTSTATHLNSLSLAMGSASWVQAGALTPDNYLIMGPFDFTGITSGLISLSWNVASVEAAGSQWAAENYSVYAESGLANISASTTPVFTEALQDGGQIFYPTADLTPLAGMDSVYIAIRHHAVTDMNLLVVDNILVNQGAPADVEEAELNAKVFTFENNLYINSAEVLSGAEMTVVNAIGQTVMTKQLNGQNFNYEMSALTSGVYFVNINNEGKIKTVKVVL